MPVSPEIEKQSLGAGTDPNLPCHTHRGFVCQPQSQPTSLGCCATQWCFTQLQTEFGGCMLGSLLLWDKTAW